MRKTILAIASILVLLLSVVVSAEPVVLQFWEGASAQEEAAILKQIVAFEESHPDIKIERTKVSFGSNFEKITTAVASGTAPDVSPIWGGFLPQFADSNALVDLTAYGAEEIEQEIYPAAWDYVKWKGGIYGIPYAIDPRFIVYNKSAFAEVGLDSPPSTFDELLDYARKLTVKRGAVTDRYGFGFGGGEGLMNDFMNLLYANGGTMFNEDMTEVTFASSEGIEVATLMQEMVNGGFATGGSSAAQDTRTVFLGGKVAMFFDGPWIFFEEMKYAEGVEYGIAAVPAAKAGGTPPNVATVGAYVVFKQSKHPNEAAEFVKWLGSADAQQYRVEQYKTGVSRDVMDAPYAQAAFNKLPQLRDAQKLADYSVIYPVHAQWTRVVDELVPALEAIVSGEDPASSLTRAAQRANRLIRR